MLDNWDLIQRVEASTMNDQHASHSLNDTGEHKALKELRRLCGRDVANQSNGSKDRFDRCNHI